MKCDILFLEPCDVLVCGSTLYAIDLACSAADQGNRTLIAMERTNPYLEGICALRSQCPEGVERILSDDLRNILFDDEIRHSAHGRDYFNPHEVAKRLEDLLFEKGVRFYYNAIPVAALTSEETVEGAVFGGKPGLFAIEARQVMDCSLNSVIARTAGASTTPSSGPTRIAYSMELTESFAPTEIPLSGSGLSGSIQIHHFFADIEVTLEDGDQGPLACATEFNRVYEVAMDALESNGFERFRGADVLFHSSTPIDVAPLPNNLKVFGPLAAADNPQGQLALRDPLFLHQVFGPPSVEKPTKSMEPKAYRIQACPGDTSPPEALHHSFTDPGYQAPGSVKRSVDISMEMLTLETNLLVAGCGTSGVGAAFQAGKLGRRPLCVNGSLEIGGTNTVGGVNKLWFGNRTKAFKEFFNACDAKHGGINASPFFRACHHSGADILSGISMCGTGYENGNISCVYIITPEGLARVSAEQVIDATGDGSLAAWSGCDYTYGSERDGVPSWGSFGSFVHGNAEAARQFLSMVDERCPADATRFIVAMRRSLAERFKGKEYVHPSFYIAPRTTRHIEAKTKVTYLDMLAHRTFKDGVIRASSNIDTKGTETSDAFKAGLYPFRRMEEFEVTIPYSSLIPLNMKNLIVVGKAYSITNDALTMARMQTDLFVMGMVAAEASNLATESNTSLATVPVDRLQNRLFDLGALRPEDLTPDDRTLIELCREIKQADMEEALRPSATLTLFEPDEIAEAVKTLKFDLTPPVARLLSFLQQRDGVEALEEDIQDKLATGQLPQELYAADAKTHDLPDHGFAPRIVTQLNTLAQTGDPKAVGYIQSIAQHFDQITENKTTLWSYAFGVAYAAERLASPDLVEPLERILHQPILHVDPIPANTDVRPCADNDRERITYLKLCLLRALARCGCPAGAEGLIAFLNDARSSMAANARNELIAVTQEDFGYDKIQWKNHLSSRSEPLQPCPVTTTFE